MGDLAFWDCGFCIRLFHCASGLWGGLAEKGAALIDPNDALDPVIHAPIRLRLCAVLNPLEEAEFMYLREIVGVSESVLSKHLSRLNEAGYVRFRNGAHGGRARKWAALTKSGRKALDSHLQALRQIALIAEGLGD